MKMLTATFYSEDLMLDVVNILDPYVHKFIVVSLYSHSGRKKVSILILINFKNLRIIIYLSIEEEPGIIK